MCFGAVVSIDLEGAVSIDLTRPVQSCFFTCFPAAPVLDLFSSTNIHMSMPRLYLNRDSVTYCFVCMYDNALVCACLR